ncbi:MAG: lysophospholipid acyltransferase family protein [Sarcina ventriculi]|uniref:1-acyl-sn-glycerol-3-phosphate acyltransferase n=2 Tax=Sarcina TaxID=1266 RepID=A0ACD1BE30_9CLOT|nr:MULTISPECIES: lysophospholipid acyltransferase family protein [Sarcina]MBU5321793.1 1-acyl-sn-glycerol-3-phosphate acyltransferase [Sarcina ventriculi]MCI5635569.1 1-acyl-sn-glycerol-3-phosphate acyltransferase [Sarcina ventriculi]MDD7373029.1 lysophospholipid acyltransferase family protein [Sarcina ventriculi]MDY7063272.1 lysophospholipid acyltransferase family protein [Sarcina ventriculi]QPJ85592.1 1-acyl-sn-glycerol-3-phosphate acyltransferase [Sarcina sp. JB2]
MFRSFKWYILGYVGTLVAFIPKEKEAQKLLAEGKIDEMNNIVCLGTRTISQKLIKLSDSTVNVHGLENIPEGPVLFVSNHQSNMDIAIICGFIDKPKGFIAKKELKKLPLINKWITLAGSIYLDRENPRKSMEGILEGIKTLKNGHSLVVFPEGTRSRGDKMGEFKSGSFKLATKSKVPIVPLTIDGTYRVMEANKILIKPSNINFYVHKPIYTDKLSKEEITKLPETVEHIIRSKLPNKGE